LTKAQWYARIKRSETMDFDDLPDDAPGTDIDGVPQADDEEAG
jgi:hypothetical protein